MARQVRFLKMPGGVGVQPLTIGSLPAEWIRPPGEPLDGAVLYLHGGGYTMGSIDTHRVLAGHIACASQTPVLLVDYRLAPENPFPAALEDAVQAYHYLLDAGIPAEKVVLAGDSAGGGLAVAAALSLRDGGEPLPGAIVCISPWLDLTMTGESVTTCARADPLISLEASRWHAGMYAGGRSLGAPLLSPVFADLTGFPPLLIQVGEYEILRSDSQRLAEKARGAGVPVELQVWDGMFHVWHMAAGYLPEAGQAIARIGEFIKVCVRELEDRKIAA
jgi:monoterpene epsilon-lactone hydrolase